MGSNPAEYGVTKAKKRVFQGGSNQSDTTKDYVGEFHREVKLDLIRQQVRLFYEWSQLSSR